MHRTFRIRLLALFVLVAPGLRADAFLEESYSLVAGWNLIHVAVEPVVKDPLAALSTINWDSLWTWLPTEGEPRGGRWLAIYRDQPAFLGTLFSLTGPRSYFILTPSGGTLRIRGAVRSGRQALRGGAYQLFAPRFDRSSPPTFASYFSRPGVKEHIGEGFELAGQAYRRLSSGTLLRPGAAYWLFPARDLPTPDPVRLGVGVGGLRFDAQTTVSELVVDLGDGTEGQGGGGGLESRQLNLRATALVPPGGQGNTDWLELQGADGVFAAVGAGATIEVAPARTSVRVTLRAVRPNTSTASTADQQAVIELSTPQGQVVVAAELDVPSIQGTWIGDATITEVERPSFYGGGFAPAPQLAIALILQVPTAGPASLLPCVKVAAARDGRNFGYRLESALLHEEVPLLGSIGSDGTTGTVVGVVDLPPDHPLNPYRHRYNPEHRTGYALKRTVRLEFGATVPGNEPAPSAALANVGVLSGVYEDEIVGLTQEPIRLRGPFRLRRLAAGTALPCGTAGQ